MSSESDSERASTSSHKSKGKARDVSERTPLLANASGSSLPSENFTPRTRSRIGTQLLCVFITSLIICVLALAILALLLWSYLSRASNMSPEQILHEAMVFEGPDRVDILNISWSGGIWMNVEGRVGLDAGAVAGVNTDPRSDGLLESIWKSFGRWGVRNLGSVSVNSSKITITASQDQSVILAILEIPPVEVPLTVDPPPERTWLHQLSTPVFVRPTSNTSALVHFVREAWQEGAVRVNAFIDEVDVHGGALSGHGWKQKLHQTIFNVRTLVAFKIPDMPGLPQPGRHTPLPSFADLVTLTSFKLLTETGNMSLQAVATVVDPAPLTLNLTTPSLPFVVSLPSPNTSSVPIAAVSTEAFSLTHPNITLDITGHVLPLPAFASPILSSFLTRYLSGLSNPILISTPLIPGFDLDADFPAPQPKPRVLRDVTIHDMKVKPGNTFLASGTVVARVVLPKGMDIDLEVKSVFPDVLVFDGEVPDTVPNSITAPPPSFPPLPDPLPERAFGHIRPDDWLKAKCVPVDPEEEEGSAFAVSARFVDVALEVLPGRQKEFSDFVSKIIFAHGAVAGISGTTAVAVDVQGLPLNGPEGQEGMYLSGLPFRGNVNVGKESIDDIMGY